jgi:hypothetical protein
MEINCLKNKSLNIRKIIRLKFAIKYSTWTIKRTLIRTIILTTTKLRNGSQHR